MVGDLRGGRYVGLPYLRYSLEVDALVLEV